MTIGAKRVVSIESTCNVIKRVNEALFEYFSAQLSDLLLPFHQAKHSETLYTHFQELDGELRSIRALLLPGEELFQGKNMEDIILRSAMSQLAANRNGR